MTQKNEEPSSLLKRVENVEKVFLEDKKDRTSNLDSAVRFFFGICPRFRIPGV